MSSDADPAAARGIQKRLLRLLIVDDSPVARSVLSRMVSPHSAFEVTASVGSAAEALAALEHQPADIVLLDLDMPGTGGLEALPLIVATGAKVLVVSSSCGEGQRISATARGLGATDTLGKPGADQPAALFSAALVQRLKRIGGIENPDAKGVKERGRDLRDPTQRELQCVLLGGSTGGLHAITAFLRALPAGFRVPILITQHLPAVFMPFFARQAEAAAGRPARVAVEGDRIEADTILLAPGDAHLVPILRGGQLLVTLDSSLSPGGYRPSVDRMFEGASDVFGPTAAGIVFSGMGRDGLAGARAIVSRGGTIHAQDRASCAVWGMPRAVVEAGLASAESSPAELAALVAASVAVLA